MQCAVCQHDLDDGAEECPECGATVVPDSERTNVAGVRPSDTTGGPPRGEVLGERWEVGARLETTAVTTRYRALDQESEEEVVITLIAPELVPTERDREAIRERLASAVGVGNKFVPGLMAADREGRFVWAVEPDVPGATLREVMGARRMRGETMRPAELLPVVAQIATGLGAIPPPFRHGDVRAERVRIHGEGLALTGAFLMPALPASAVAQALGADTTWSRAAAPEVARGGASDAADRYGVALLAFEALAGVAWTQGGRLPAGLEELDQALRSLLAADPLARSKSLDGLVAALARAAKLPVPSLEAAPFRRVRKAPSQRPPPRASQPPPRASQPPLRASEPPRASQPPPRASEPPRALQTEPGASEPQHALQTEPGARPTPKTDPEGERVGPKTDPEGERVGPKTDPEGMLVGSRTEPGVLLVPDGLPPSYRLDEAQTMPESSKLTRRVVAFRDEDEPSPPEETTRPGARPGSPLPRSPEETTKPAAKAPSPSAARAPGAPPPATAGGPRPPSTPPARKAPEVAELDEESTQMNASVALAALASRPRAIAGAAKDGTHEIAMDELQPTRGKEGASKGAPASDIDPRLLRAALAPQVDKPAPAVAEETPPPKRLTGDTQQLALDELEVITADGIAKAKKKRQDDSLDPRLVRAALGVMKDDTVPPPQTRQLTEEIRLEDVEVVPGKRKNGGAAPRSAPAGAIGTRPAGPGASRPVSSPPAATRPGAQPTVAARAPLPAQAPPRASAPPAAAPRPAPPRAAAPAVVVPLSRGLPNEPARARPAPSRAPVLDADDSAGLPSAPRARRSDGMTVIWISILVAVVIVAIGGFIKWRRHVEESELRERALQQRFEQLRQQH